MKVLTFVFAVIVVEAAEAEVAAPEVVDKLAVLVTAALAGLLTLLCSCPPRKLRTLPPALALRTWPRRTGGRIADGNRWNPAAKRMSKNPTLKSKKQFYLQGRLG